MLKVLSIANYATNDSLKDLSRNKTGYGYVVQDILMAMSKRSDVTFYSYSGNYTTFAFCGVKYLGNRIVTILVRSRKLWATWSALKFILKTRSISREVLRVCYAYYAQDYINTYIALADVIHIHGCSPNLYPAWEAANNSDKGVVVTLHGLNSFSEHSKASLMTKEWEKRFLGEFVQSKKAQLTVLTNATKEIVVKYCGPSVANRIHVIPNFLRDEFCSAKTNKVKGNRHTILYVGNISKQKNQAALLQAVVEHRDRIGDRFRFVFCGEVCDASVDIYKTNDLLKGVVEFHGHVPRANLNQYYLRASLVVLLSKVEGFGMSVIEALAYGVPVLINGKMEIASMLEESDCVTLINDVNNTKEIIDKLLQAVDKNCESKDVKLYCRRFSEGSVLRLYNDCFAVAIANR
ncbi:glycosyltransferase family 4 protein [Candidatus Accumulibacter contiguus]|jgi:glycosyltransferase involved in cell wall biosynthesis|uniref:glycosyltransferase family 4 protein n=1 Tax=Candidatus Accumulibacter contiguus TaxID=2954381 RepID=UPI002FC301C1